MDWSWHADFEEYLSVNSFLCLLFMSMYANVFL